MRDIKIPLENIDLLEFFGVNNSKLQIIRTYFQDLTIIGRGNHLILSGEESTLKRAEEIITALKEYYLLHHKLPEKIINEVLNTTGGQNHFDKQVILHGKNNRLIYARTPNQLKLVQSIEKNDIVFAIGPAGTGKTYTAVALAVKALRNKEVKRIILTRPAVEAGENLGFLPGDMREKIDPYLRPLYDALDDMLPADKMAAHLERKVIEIAPLAFMRGRTLDHAFVILDEAQNSTQLQLKMFLTRMGPSAKFIITGDLTQIDLPPKQNSGLIQAIELLNGIRGIDVVRFTVEDVTRHPLVKQIINAYEKIKKQ